jgi:hypothetical protein
MPFIGQTDGRVLLPIVISAGQPLGARRVFRSYRAGLFLLFPPTACAVGCILSLLRGWTTSDAGVVPAGLVHCANSVPALPCRALTFRRYAARSDRTGRDAVSSNRITGDVAVERHRDCFVRKCQQTMLRGWSGARSQSPRLFLQPTLELQPLGEAVDPMIGGEVLLVHSEAVATLGVHVQFDRLPGVRPLLVQSNTLRREPE